MLVLMKKEATPAEIANVKQKVAALGYKAHEIPGAQCTAIGITGNREKIPPDLFSILPGVAGAIPVSKPYKLVGRDARRENSIFDAGGLTIGGPELTVIAGPCSVESREQLFATARAVKQAGAKFLRGGAFKPRTSPYAFQGMKEVADVIQIGARNMNNVGLLEAVGEMRKPVLLKRGIASTIEELLMAAEYIAARGNLQIILCERGIRTFEPATRNTLDLNAVPVLKKLSHLPVFVDPSHGIGLWDGVAAMTLAGIAAGADGVMIEVHPDPASALSDGPQSLKPQRFTELMRTMRRLAPVLDRTVAGEEAA
jgi:3-deoxy-7-phosphoheptulonate synthase